MSRIRSYTGITTLNAPCTVKGMDDTRVRAARVAMPPTAFAGSTSCWMPPTASTGSIDRFVDEVR